MADCGLENLKRYLKKLKFDEPVILNSFQDLTQGTGEEMLNQVQHDNQGS